jgi:uncharacterized protein (TIGR00255 family)
MTGYGKATVSSDNVELSVEMKSVNSRYLDINPKTPRILNSFDDEINKQIKLSCERGRISLNCTINYLVTDSSSLAIDMNKLRQYVKTSKLIGSELGVDDSVSVDQLMRTQDIFIPDDKEKYVEEIKTMYFNAVSEAMSQLILQREKEGEHLRQDLVERLENLGTILVDVESISTLHREKDFNNYKSKISELIEDSSLDDSRIIQEAAILSEKRDISEEIVRFKSHMKLYKSYFDDSQNTGRKMNFLLQEMGREVNTIGSKTDQIEISHLVVQMKDELEKMREQVQNIL